jgi:hypothetical protein
MIRKTTDQVVSWTTGLEWVGGLGVYENGSNIYIIIQRRREMTMSARGARINWKETGLNLSARNSLPAWGCQRLHRSAPTECDREGNVSRLVSARWKGKGDGALLSSKGCCVSPLSPSCVKQKCVRHVHHTFMCS